MFIFTVEDIIFLSSLGLCALVWFAIYVETKIRTHQAKKRKQKQKGV